MKLKWKWRMGLAVALCSTMATVSAALPSNVKNYIVFGDSLSDMGNNTWVDGFKGAPITNQPTSAAKELWPNVLIAAERKQAVSQSDPLLSSQFTAHKGFDPHIADVNYAYASAETGDNYLNDMSKSSFPPYVQCDQPGYNKATGVSCVPGMLTQISLYFNHLSAKGHAAPNPNTVYFLWAGGNDFFNDIAKLLEHSNNNASFVRGVQQLSASWQGRGAASGWMASLSNPVKNIKAAVDLLHAHGVAYDHIYVFNLPDMSKTPAAQAMAAAVAQGKYKNVILTAVQLLSSIYNGYLNFDLTVMDPLPSQNLFKINHLFYLMETNKTIDQQYDLSNLTNSCVADGKNPACIGYVFYNGKHPTLQVEKMISDYFTDMPPH